MTKEQLEFIKSEINRAYLFLLGHGNIDPSVIELKKLAALAEAHRRYEAKETWRSTLSVILAFFRYSQYISSSLIIIFLTKTYCYFA